ncbi:MAG TPA: zinc-ribbon domain-containing protein [Candidatus Methylomirabilis sp.]
MAAPVFDLQPMSIGDILDRTVRLYQRSFLHTLGIVSVPYLLLVPLLVAFGSVLWATRDPKALLNPAVMVGISLFAVAFFWLNFVSMGALARSVSERYLGGTPALWGCYQPVFQRSGALLWAYLLALLAAGGIFAGGVVLPIVIAALLIRTSVFLFLLFGLVAVVGAIASLRVFFRLFLVTQVIVIEDMRGVEALRRSWKLMQGNETRAFLVSLFGAVVGYIVSLVLRLPTSILAGLNPGPAMAVVDGVVGGIAQIVSVPFVSIPFTLLYYDGRIRKEAFDLEMMARNLGAPGRPAGPAAGRAPAPSPGAPEPMMGPAPSGTVPPRPAPVTPSTAPRGPAGTFKVCPKCGAQVSLTRPACPSCGTPVPFRPAG